MNAIDKVKKNSSEFVITGLAQGLFLFQSLVQTKMFTKFFETSFYGQWSLIVSVYTLISMLPFSAIDQGIGKVVFFSRKEKKEKQLYCVIGISYFLFFIFYSIVLVILKFLQRESFFADGFLLLFLIYSFTEILKNTYITIDNAYRNRRRVLYIRLFELLSRTVILWVTYKKGLFYIPCVLLIFIVTNFVILLIQREYFSGGTFILDKEYIKKVSHDILSFSAPLLTWAVFGWMQNMISRWYLDAMLDLESVAKYSVLTSLSYFVPNAVYVVVSAYIMPIIYQRNSDVNRKYLLKFLFVIFLPLMIYWCFISFFGKYLVLILTDSKYLDICEYLPITTFTAILYVVAMLSTVEIYRRGKTDKLIISTILPGLFMATVGYYIIKKFGFGGAVVNYMLGHLMYLLLTMIVVFNKNNINT